MPLHSILLPCHAPPPPTPQVLPPAAQARAAALCGPRGAGGLRPLHLCLHRPLRRPGGQPWPAAGAHGAAGAVAGAGAGALSLCGWEAQQGGHGAGCRLQAQQPPSRTSNCGSKSGRSRLYILAAAGCLSSPTSPCCCCCSAPGIPPTGAGPPGAQAWRGAEACGADRGGPAGWGRGAAPLRPGLLGQPGSR